MNRNTNISSIKRVNRKLKEVSRFSRAKQRQENVQKSVLHVHSCVLLIRKSVLHLQNCFFFLQIRSTVVVFTALVAFTLSLLDFIFSLRKR